MIASNDGPHFIARGVGARCILRAARRRDHELVCRKNQFRRDTFPGVWDCFIKKAVATFPFRRQHLGGAQDFDDVPFFRRANERDPTWLRRSTWKNPGLHKSPSDA